MAAALILVALSVGLSNLAAAIGIGVGGIDRRTRLRVGIIYGLFEAAMPVAGLLIGHGLARSLGRATDWLAAGLLILVGGASIAAAIRGRTAATPKARRATAAVRRGTAAVRRGTAAARRATAEARTGTAAARRGTAEARAGTAEARPAGAAARPAPGDQAGILRLIVTGFALSLDNLAAGFALGSYQVSVLAGVLAFGVISAAMSLAGLEFGARIGRRAGQAGQVIGGFVVAGVGVAIGVGALG
jgi:putative Mn2+ efflux pump MntP